MEQKFALIVGNDQFEDSRLTRLVSPGSEACDLANILKDPEIGGFDEVTTLLNESEARVRRCIASLFTRKEPDDLLLLYFSTHGLLDENGLLFLAARDTQRDLLDATSVEAAFVTKMMNNSLSRRQVLILDCCHSGAFARGTKGVPGASVGTATAFEGNGFGHVVLTATDSTQYAWDGDKVIGGSNFLSSVFTRHLIEGLRTGAADEDDDGQITLDELYGYVYRQVLSETPRQTPKKWSYKQQGNLVIARNPHPGRKIALPDHLQKALESDFRPTREGAILELQRYLDGSHAGLARAAERTLEKISAEDDSHKVRRLAAEILADFRRDRSQESLPVQPPVRSREASKARPSRSSESDIPSYKPNDGPRQTLGPPVPSPIEDPLYSNDRAKSVSPSINQASSGEPPIHSEIARPIEASARRATAIGPPLMGVLREKHETQPTPHNMTEQGYSRGAEERPTLFSIFEEGSSRRRHPWETAKKVLLFMFIAILLLSFLKLILMTI